MVDFHADSTSHRPTQPIETTYPNPLTSAHVSKALQDSVDDGTTLVFSRLNLTDVGTAIEELARYKRQCSPDQSAVERIALDHNRLTNLPTEFALVSRLRYLNLKHNNFQVLPDVLTAMSSLDTLDVSYNRISMLPSEPGCLINLRVFCLSRNKIVRLPPYLSEFGTLEVLRVERNPIEWPPKHVINPTGGLDSRPAMQAWIRTLQRWMELQTRARHNDSGKCGNAHSPDNFSEEVYNKWKLRLREHPSPTPHSRSFSMDSNFSTSSVLNCLKGTQMSASPEGQTLAPPLRLGILGSSNEPSPTRSFEICTPSPANSESFQDQGITVLSDTDPQTQQYSPAGSYNATQSGSSRTFSRKKSSPDFKLEELYSAIDKLSSTFDENATQTTSFNTGLHDGFPSLSSARQQHVSALLPFSLPSTPVKAELVASTARSLIFYRDSYLKRLSSLSLSRSLPTSLVRFLDSTRSILFALVEIYHSVERSMVYTVDDRILVTIRKATASASREIFQLINALERFDIVSQKMVPSPAIFRAVIESCKDTVTTFCNAIGIINLQLKFAIHEDVRFSRWMLFELHTATAEISSAWRTMVQQIDLIKPLLRAKTFYPSSSTLNSTGPDMQSPSLGLTPTDSTAIHRLQTLAIPTLTHFGRTRTTRRNAGSFSSKDVEIGRDLPSHDDLPISFGGKVRGNTSQLPVLRGPKRQHTTPATSVQSPSINSPITQLPTLSSNGFQDNFISIHSRQGSQASLLDTALNSPSPPRTMLSDSSTDSQSRVDKEAIQVIHGALEIAPLVCDMMEEVLGEIMNIKPSVRDTIRMARVATMKLSDTVRNLENANTVLQFRQLREDAHTFLKGVVQLSNIVKTYAGLHTASSDLRISMIKLTSSTEEIAILLHVSSLAPSRSRLPTLNVLIPPTNSATLDETRRTGNSSARSQPYQTATPSSGPS